MSIWTRRALTVFETPSGTPYHYDLFGGRDVGHTLMLGATGAGKSFTLNYLLVQALQYHPRVLILDLGGSYRALTQFLGGGYVEVSPEQDAIKLRPFALEPSERTMQFLSAWVLRLLKIGGWEPQSGDLSEVRSRIEDLYALPRPRRALGNLVHLLPRAMWPALSRWHGTGAWGRWFDNPPSDEADVQLSDWQVIDLAGAAEHEALCEAALFYLLERLRLSLENPDETARVKLMVVDEAWRYLRDPAVLAYLAEAAKTWRKKNAALIMATQSAVDVTGTAGAEALLESMPTKLFLANPELPDKAAESERDRRTPVAGRGRLGPQGAPAPGSGAACQDGGLSRLRSRLRHAGADDPRGAAARRRALSFATNGATSTGSRSPRPTWTSGNATGRRSPGLSSRSWACAGAGTGSTRPGRGPSGSPPATRGTRCWACARTGT